MIKVVKYLLWGVLRSRVINAYLVSLLLLSFGLFGFTNDPDKGLLGISNLSLLLVPLVCMIFTGINLYNGTDFLRLLLIQPLGRTTVFLSYYIAIVVALLYAFVLGVGLPVMLFGAGPRVLIVMFSGVILTLIFSSLAFLISFAVGDKVKGIGLILFFWLFLTVIYDGVMLLLVQAMSDYPIEQYSIALALLNPVDMCRILIMFTFDIATLMGLTGTVLQAYLGTTSGVLLIGASLMLWFFLPLYLAGRVFLKKDF